MNSNTETCPEIHLSQITTEWSVVFNAHRQDPVSACDIGQLLAAQQRVLKRYGSCIYSYLLGACRDANEAEELSQEFAYRFVRGDLQNASPDHGRFRDYLKAVLRNIVNDYFRRRKKEQDLHVNLDSQIMHRASPLQDFETDFRECFRQDALNLAWNQLRHYQHEKSNHYFTVLRFRAEHPAMESAAMAEQLSVVLDRSVSAEWVRQNLRRARTKFSELLVFEVSKTLGSQATREEIDRELVDLRLMKYL